MQLIRQLLESKDIRPQNYRCVDILATSLLAKRDACETPASYTRHPPHLLRVLESQSQFASSESPSLRLSCLYSFPSDLLGHLHRVITAQT